MEEISFQKKKGKKEGKLMQKKIYLKIIPKKKGYFER